jgi:hypothetical protein
MGLLLWMPSHRWYRNRRDYTRFTICFSAFGRALWWCRALPASLVCFSTICSASRHVFYPEFSLDYGLGQPSLSPCSVDRVCIRLAFPVSFREYLDPTGNRCACGRRDYLFRILSRNSRVGLSWINPPIRKLTADFRVSALNRNNALRPAYGNPIVQRRILIGKCLCE